MKLNTNQWAGVAAGLALSASLGLNAFLGFHEGYRLKPYRDSGGVWTACTGVTGPEVDAKARAGGRFTAAECEALDAARMETALQCVDSLVSVDLTDEERIAWASFCYNVGRGNFAASSALKLLNAGKYAEACASARANWHRGGGVPHLLDDRRSDEYKLCMNELG
jgi:lysozyme